MSVSVNCDVRHVGSWLRQLSLWSGQFSLSVDHSARVLKAMDSHHSDAFILSYDA